MSRRELAINEGSTFTNERACKCFNDGARIKAGEGIGVFIPSRGKRYLCQACARETRQTLSYHSNARQGFQTIGTQKVGAVESVTIGVEFEALVIEGINDYTLRRYLMKIGKIEDDGSVDWETPTAVMRGLKTLSKACEYIERGGFLPCFNNERCGAHVHAHCTKVPYVRRYYHSIFLPLARYIRAMSDEHRVEVFGSTYRYYAQDINSDSNPRAHANIFNTQHEYTLEFRLPRITGKNQYMEVVKFWREVVYTINTFEFHEDGDRYTRLNYAQKCGEALVKVARKYFD